MRRNTHNRLPDDAAELIRRGQPTTPEQERQNPVGTEKSKLQLVAQLREEQAHDEHHPLDAADPEISIDWNHYIQSRLRDFQRR